MRAVFKFSPRRTINVLTCLTMGFSVMSAGAALAAKPSTAGRQPPLVIVNDPLPTELQNRLYNRPVSVPTISPQQISGPSYFVQENRTPVGERIDGLQNDLANLQQKVGSLTDQLRQTENSSQAESASYYANVATISTQLQTGTTPGNPRLVQRLTQAREHLDKLTQNVAAYNALSLEIANAATTASFLLDSTRSAYTLTGAIEEDHVELAQLEDNISGTVVVIDRLMNDISGDSARTAAYLSAERENLRTLSLAVASGDLFGKSFTNKPFGTARLDTAQSLAAGSGLPERSVAATAAPVPVQGQYVAQAPAAPVAAAPEAPASAKPLVKIRFTRQDVAFEQPVYMAINEALARYPNARFEIVAVYPQSSNAAAAAIEGTRARRNAERVARSIGQMGLPGDRMDMTQTPSASATTNEVHIYVR